MSSWALPRRLTRSDMAASRPTSSATPTTSQSSVEESLSTSEVGGGPFRGGFFGGPGRTRTGRGGHPAAPATSRPRAGVAARHPAIATLELDGLSPLQGAGRRTRYVIIGGRATTLQRASDAGLYVPALRPYAHKLSSLASNAICATAVMGLALSLTILSPLFGPRVHPAALVAGAVALFVGLKLLIRSRPRRAFFDQRESLDLVTAAAVAFDVGEEDKAEELLEAACEVPDLRTVALTNLGVLYRLRGDGQAARATFLSAATANLVLRGRTYEQLDPLERGIISALKAARSLGLPELVHATNGSPTDVRGALLELGRTGTVTRIRNRHNQVYYRLRPADSSGTTIGRSRPAPAV